MVYDPRVRTEHLDAYNAGRFDEIKPEIFEEVKALAERINAAKKENEVIVSEPSLDDNFMAPKSKK